MVVRISFSIILLYGVGGSSCFINYGTMKMRTVQSKRRTVLWILEHYNAILYNTFLNGTLWIMGDYATHRGISMRKTEILVSIATEPHIFHQLIVAYWRHMATQMWVNTGSGNGLVPDGTKPLPEPMLTLVRCCGIHLRAIPQLGPKLLSCIMS